MIVDTLRRVPPGERRRLAADEATTRRVLIALRDVLGPPDHLDATRVVKDYRVLKWRSGPGRPPQPDVVKVLDRSLQVLFSLNSYGVRMVVSREIPSQVFRHPERTPKAAETARRRAVARAARAERLRNISGCSMETPDHLGWKVLIWNGELLRSPSLGTCWPEDGVLEADNWKEVGAGIHAVRLPVDWEVANPRHNNLLRSYAIYDHPYYAGVPVDVVLERFGEAVVGDNGWRAQRAVIRRVRAPDVATGLAIELRYPGVDVFYPPDKNRRKKGA